MANSGGLEALFAKIGENQPPQQPKQPQPQSQANQQQQQQQRGYSYPPSSLFNYHSPAVSSPLMSPPANGTPPHHGSDIISPRNGTPRVDSRQQQQQQSGNADRASNLLNLLKVNQPPSSNAASPKPQEEASATKPEGDTGAAQGGHSKGISVSDIMAQFMPKPADKQGGTAPEAAPPAEQQQQPVSGHASGDAAQEMLLPLLHRPKSQTTTGPESVNMVGEVTETSQPAPTTETEPKPDTSDTAKVTEQEFVRRTSSPLRTFGAEEGVTTPFEPPKPQQGSKGGIFTYVNPFEQLAAASPAPAPHQQGQGVKPQSGRGSPAKDVGVAGEQRKPGPEMTPDTSADAQTPPFAESQVKIKKETVPEALEEVAEKVDMQADAALKRAALEKAVAVPEKGKEEQPVNDEKKEIHVKTEVKKEVSEVPQDTTNPAKDDLDDTWENEPEQERIVTVYSFPLKPFVSITWKRTAEPESTIRDDSILNIAKLKKSFDQLDRSLTAATSEYIVYALAKNGGMRVIRQDDGQDRRVFHANGDRIFHVSICRAVSGSGDVKDQAVLGTGVSGTVYWAPITKGGDDLFEGDALDSASLIFPPFPASDENTSGGQLKTRARRSSRHPEFFAIGRGKSIHVVWPVTAVAPKYMVTNKPHEIDTEKFFKERALKIATGKAGKDFAFSDDDSVIVSLDKTGRMRFWDIRQLTETKASAVPKGSEIRVPLLTLATGSPSEKSWPTSVLFVDKLRPYQKQSALRYVLVGLKQNHTLQLWDIGLGKSVQELQFPHSNESDAICSVAYHPHSGVLVIGHPTRNSIYFIHLSTPRYTLATMTQAGFIQSVAEKDPELPKPQSTACMSGIRELSFSGGNLRQLRSLELLPISKSATSQRGMDEGGSGLFELYVMHSRGVTCLTITKADLGWSIDNKIVRSVDSLENELIEIKGLQSFASQPDEQSVNGSGNGEASIATTNGKGKEPAPSAEPVKEQKKKDTAAEPTTSSTEKGEKKKKKKAKEEEKAEAAPQKPKVITKGAVEQKLDEKPAAAEFEVAPAPAEPAMAAAAGDLGVTAESLKKEVQRIENAVSAEFTKSFNRELDAIYRRFDEDRRAHDDAATARQDAVLRLVSSTLSDNVEKNLSRIISSNIESNVVPALANITTSAMDKQINETLSQRLDSVVPRSINNALPEIVSRTFKSQEVKNTLAELIAPAVVSRAESEFTNSVRNKILPSVRDEYMRSTEKVTKDVEQRFAAKLEAYEAQRVSDNAKIDQLTGLVSTLSETVSSMAATQSAVQNEILALTRDVNAKTDKAQGAGVPGVSSGQAHQPAPASPEEIELAEITQLMEEKKYEDASIRWLQSTQQADLFDRLFVKYDPSYLSSLAPLVALSVSAAVTASLDNNVEQRLGWLHHVLQTVDVRDADIVQVAPQIIDIITQRLGKLYMSIAESNPHHPILRKIPPITRWATDLKAQAELDI